MSIKINIQDNNTSVVSDVKKDITKIEAQVVIGNVTPDATRHNLLRNLDYAESGHTGFVGERLSIYPEAKIENKKERLSLYLYADNNNSPARISLQQIKDMNTKVFLVNNEAEASLINAELGDFIYIKKM